MEHLDQVAGVYRYSICVEYGLEGPKSKWDTPVRFVENDEAKIL